MRNFAGPDAHTPTAVSPYEQGLMAAATLDFSAERSGQRLGALLFDCGIERIFPPRKGRHHTMAFISGALQYQRAAPDNAHKVIAPGSVISGGNEKSGSNLGEALRGAARLLGKRSMVVVISDFLCAAWDQEFTNICRKHDMLAIRIKSHIDGKLPDWGLVTMEDPETLHRVTAPTRFRSFREAWATWHEQRAEFWSTACRRCGAAQLELSTDVDASESLYKFFSARSGSREGNK
jgi:uncharacterized protein (DUF58 family)